MAALHPFTLGGSGGMLPQEILVILSVLRYILVHSEAYRKAYRASWGESHHHNHHCLLSYWNTGNHLHRLGSMPIPQYLYACTNQCMHAQHMNGKLIDRVIVRIVRIGKPLRSYHYQGRRQLFRGGGEVRLYDRVCCTQCESNLYIQTLDTTYNLRKLFIPLLFF